MKIFKKSHKEVAHQQNNTYVYDTATYHEHEFKTDPAPKVSTDIKHKNKRIKGKKPKQFDHFGPFITILNSQS